MTNAGLLAALGAALCWAVSTTILKFVSQSISPISLSVLRCAVASVFFAFILFVSGRGLELSRLDLAVGIYLAVSALIGISLGDTLYIWGLSYVDVSRAYPVSMGAYPVLTLVLALIFLKENINWQVVLGMALVISGIYLVAVRGASAKVGKRPKGRSYELGLMLILMAAFCWAISAILLKVALVRQPDVILANTVRMPLAAATLSILAWRQPGGWQFRAAGFRTLGLSAAAGLVSYGFGGILFMVAVMLTGAAKAVILSGISPLMLVPLSVIFLKERITARLGMGAFLCVAGVALTA